MYFYVLYYVYLHVMIIDSDYNIIEQKDLVKRNPE